MSQFSPFAYQRIEFSIFFSKLPTSENDGQKTVMELWWNQTMRPPPFWNLITYISCLHTKFEPTRSIQTEDMAILPTWKMAATATFFKKMIIFAMTFTLPCHFTLLYKVCKESVQPRRRNKCQCDEIKNGSRRQPAILNLGPMDFLVMSSNSECYIVSSCKIWHKSLNPGRSYG